MEPTYRRLSSPHSNLIIKTHPYAEIVWWGSALQHFNPDDCISLERPVANGRLDIDTPLTLMAENGLGLFGSPGLEGHRNGLDASPVFRTVRVEQIGHVGVALAQRGEQQYTVGNAFGAREAHGAARTGQRRKVEERDGVHAR